MPSSEPFYVVAARGHPLLRKSRVAPEDIQGEDLILARERHLQALSLADDCLEVALNNISRLELCAEELRLGQQALSEITGEFTADDLLGTIFSRFCIGK